MKRFEQVSINLMSGAYIYVKGARLPDYKVPQIKKRIIHND